MDKKMLHELYAAHQGKVSDKWFAYFSEYDRIFTNYRDKPICLLEIGIQNGGSLELWAKYFSRAKKLVGCDINQDCTKLTYDDARICVIVGNANADDTQERIQKESDYFDIIIDDGSHTSSDIVKTFCRYFPCLENEGVFVAEDLHCSYWRESEGGLFDPFSSVSFFKLLVDVINQEHWGIDRSRSALLAGFRDKYALDLEEDVLAQVHSVEFINSLCVVRKRSAVFNGLGYRVIAGQTEVVVPGILQLNYTSMQSVPQEHNFWTIRPVPPAEELQQRLEEIASLSQAIAERNGQIARLNQALAERDSQIASLSQTVAERNAQITDLSQAVAERDGRLSAVYRSHSWIVTSPLRWSHKLLAYAIDHVKFLWRDRFVPLRGLEPLADGRWRALDEDPQFDVRLSKFGLGRGWYRVEIEGQGLQQPKLYLGCGNDDYNGSECYPLISRKGRFEANLRLNEPVFRVRFDPRKIPGEFTLRKLVIRRRWIFGILADKAITIYRRDRQRGMSPIAIGAHYWAVVRQLGPRQLITKLNHLPATPNSDTKGDVELTYEQWINHVEKAYFTDLKEKSAPAATRKHVFFVFVTSRSASWLPSVLCSLTAQKMASWRATIFCEDIEAGYFHAFPAEDERIRFERFGSDEIKLELARLNDETVTLISPGASLSPYYLLALEQELSGCADKQYIVYTDNDLLDSHGSRFDPNFKPDWSPDYFLEYDYVGGVISVSAPLLANSRVYACPEAGLAAWWVLLQQAVGRLCANVLHIPFVLFHREEQMAESYRLERRQQLLNEELKPFGASAVTGKHQATFRIQYSPPANEPSVTIIIPTRDRVDLLQRCISTLVEKTHYSNYELVIVDNQSCEAQTKRYLTKIAESEKVRVLQYDHPFNFSAINNFAVEQTESDLLCFLNNDVEIIDSDWLTEMVSREKQPGTGCVGVKLLYPNGNVQHAGVLIGKGGVAGHIFRGRDPEATGYQNRLVTVQNYSAVTAACLLTPRELFVKLGGFNEQHLAVAFNDVDYCLRVREAGRKVCWTPHVRLVHHESESRGDDADRAEAFAQEIRFMKVRWSRWIMNDPAYNRHLALSDAEFRPSARWLHREEQRPGRESLNPAREPYAFESNIDRARLVLAGGRSFDTSKHFMPGLSVVVLTLEKPELIGPLLDALVDARQVLKRNFGLEMEIIIGDTGSKRDDVRSIYAKHEREIRLENGMQYHFARCNNDLFERHVNYDKVLFLNNDIVFSDASAQLLEMCRVLDRESATGVLGTQLMYPDGRLQHGGVDIFKTGELKGLCYHPGHGQEIKSFLPVGETQAFPAVTGACLLIRSSLFRDCGGFDERYSAEAQDVDLCIKAKRLGWNTKLVHVGKVIHIENATRTKGEENNQDRARFVRKWSGFYEVAF